MRSVFDPKVVIRCMTVFSFVLPQVSATKLSYPQGATLFDNICRLLGNLTVVNGKLLHSLVNKMLILLKLY